MRGDEVIINQNEIEASGLDIKIVRSLARRLENVAKEAQKHGIQIFGGSGSGSLRFNDRHDAGSLVIAHINRGDWSGGDGLTDDEFDGLERGEY